MMDPDIQAVLESLGEQPTLAEVKAVEALKLFNRHPSQLVEVFSKSNPYRDRFYRLLAFIGEAVCYPKTAEDFEVQAFVKSARES